jgi:hypothetical protein
VFYAFSVQTKNTISSNFYTDHRLLITECCVTTPSALHVVYLGSLHRRTTSAACSLKFWSNQFYVLCASVIGPRHLCETGSRNLRWYLSNVQVSYSFGFPNSSTANRTENLFRATVGAESSTQPASVGFPPPNTQVSFRPVAYWSSKRSRCTTTSLKR